MSREVSPHNTLTVVAGSRPIRVAYLFDPDTFDGDRVDAITEEYLAFARFPRPQYDEDSVNEMVAALVEFVRPVANRQGSTVEATTDQTVPPMAIDRTLLRQSILNLVKNGLEALGRGGKLIVSTRRLDDHVEIASNLSVGALVDEEDAYKGFGAHSDRERLAEKELYRFVVFNWEAVNQIAAKP